MPHQGQDRYTRIAVILHWLIAFAVLAMLISGLLMTDFISDKVLQFQLYQWHKASGLVVMVLVLLRLVWRFGHKPPPFPSSMPGYEKKAAHGTHWAFYILLISIPLTGWIMVSASPFGLPTLIYGLFEWPHIPGLVGMEWVEELAKDGHEILTLVIMILIGLHIAGAIKHTLIDKENILRRMWF
jgi:cytochrome b561